MFAKSIYGLDITSRAANSLFENINGDNFGDDESFLATLRILLHKRADIPVNLYHRTKSYNPKTAKDSKSVAMLRDLLCDCEYNQSGAISVITISGNEESNTYVFGHIDAEDARKEHLSGYEELKDLAAYLGQRKFRTRFFINRENKSSVIISERTDLRRWHLLQSLVSRYVPWFFAENPLTDNEFSLIKSLTSRESADYESCVFDASKQFDFRAAKIRTELNGFEVKAERDAYSRVKREVSDLRDAIEAVQRQFSDYYAQLEEAITRELGLAEKIRKYETGETASELVEFLTHNKTFHLVHTSGSAVEFIIKTVVSNFDPDMFRRIIDNPKGAFYRHYETGRAYGNPDLTDERIKKLMTAILGTEELKLRVCAAYSLDFGRGNVQAKRNYSYPADILYDSTPNQHIQYYGCLGNNHQVINKALMAKDYIGAIVACMSSAANMNLGENNTITWFMREICNPNVGKIIQMPDGSVLTPVEAAKWLEARDEEKAAKATKKTAKTEGA